LNIEIPDAAEELEIYNISGIMLERISLSNVEQFQLDCSMYPNGIYFLNIKGKIKFKPEKFIINRY
jgi:hypothetical protein